uniref:phosphatidylinositol N-acetylglucosaminyltransferase n=1 Tax=Oryza punctata TaxID=4537 RepID=A0A0E0LJ70_ORYPU
MENATGERIADQIGRFQTQLQMDGRGRKHRILMVSDFFFPNFGGVESHIYYLSQCLLKLGHKVVVMTHAYGKRSGVRYVTGGLKVYYVPWKPFLMQNTLPTLFLTFPIVRTILIREKISVVHGHQAFSTLCHEALMHARTMGYKVVFTDHSLYGFADAGSIHMNKVLQFTLADIDQAICVSHTSKENTVLRSGISPEKGADLLVEVIPEVCRLFPKVRFIVGGDGPKRVRIEEMREKFSLQDRVEMLGAVPHAQVRSVLISEAFCIAILEAASCGLLTVSTRVGGVPEVLPDDMVVLAEPAPEDMVRAVRKAIDMLPGIDPHVMHLRMKKLYSWDDVAKRTEIVYDRAMQSPQTDLLERLPRYLTCGAWAGKLFCLVMIINYLLWCLLEYLQPTEGIEEVPDIRPVHARLESVDETCETQGKGN